jgi:mono/diheme cytochrome c family protein
MTTRWHGIRGALVACALSAVLATGCGGGDDEGGGGTEPAGGGGGSAASGEALFKERCGSCHTLAAAGTNGSVGPNLDDLAPDAARVEQAIERAPGAMPENLAEGDERQAIAEYVAGAAGGG